MNSVAVADNIVNPVVLKRVCYLRQFFKLSLSIIFDRKIEMLP